MPIKKSSGVTDTERLLADFCERTFLKLWSYPNPCKDDGHELCDLLAVFGEYVFVFFDRKSELVETPDKDPQVLWDRWKRNVVDRHVKTAQGAERYIRSGRPIFLDAIGTTPFPLRVDPVNAVVHKVIVDHGALEACRQASDQNVYGSLAITHPMEHRPMRAMTKLRARRKCNSCLKRARRLAQSSLPQATTTSWRTQFALCSLGPQQVRPWRH